MNKLEKTKKQIRRLAKGTGALELEYRFNCYVDGVFIYKAIISNHEKIIVYKYAELKIIADDNFLDVENLNDLLNMNRISYLDFAICEMRKDKNTFEVLEKVDEFILKNIELLN